MDIYFQWIYTFNVVGKIHVYFLTWHWCFNLILTCWNGDCHLGFQTHWIWMAFKVRLFLIKNMMHYYFASTTFYSISDTSRTSVTVINSPFAHDVFFKLSLISLLFQAQWLTACFLCHVIYILRLIIPFPNCQKCININFSWAYSLLTFDWLFIQ